MEGPSGTVTFLFTDIEGSTRLWEESPAAMGAALARHDAILEGAITSHGGVVFSRMGDGMAAAFASAHDCLEAALEAQRGLAQESWPDEIGELRSRMGAHTGEGVLVNGQYLNQPLNRCARLMAVAHGGQVVLSGTTEPLVRGSLPEGVVLLDLGEHRLRDLDRPMHIFQVGEHRFAPLRSLDAFPGNLPVQLTSFVGREGDLATLAEALGTARLVTLTGTGGVGKTRLAVQAAADALLEFRDGAWLCELAAASDPDSMLEVVAIALGFTPRQGVTLAQAISEFLGVKALLIVLDNCEYLLDAATGLAGQLLAACPQLRILATSREALDVDGERVVRLRSLAVPHPGATLDEILSADAPRLFIDRAEAAGVDVNLSEPSARAVVEICRRLDGIPLAIELAAARVLALSPKEIAARLDERFRLLTGGRRVAVERHHTLRATVDWSYSLLTPIEQAVFERLGTFPATFDAAGAEAVAADEEIEAWDVLDALTSLVAKSMLVADQSAEGSTRYQMLESLRHYARERLDAIGLADTIRRLHARHYATIAADIAELLRGIDELSGRSRLRIEVDNLRAAVFWGLDSTREEDGALALRTIAALVGVGSTWGWVGVGSWAQQALGRAEGEDARYRSLILAAASHSAYFRGDFALARRLADDAGRLGVVPGCPAPAMVLIPAFMYARAEDLPDLLTTALSELERVGASPWEFAWLRSAAASIAALVGNLALAQAEAGPVLELCRQMGSPTHISTALYAYGLAWWQTDPDDALATLEEGLSALGNNETLGSRTLALVAQLRASSGDMPGAFDALHRAMTIVSTENDRAACAVILARGVLVLKCAGAEEEAGVFAGTITGGVLAGLRPLPPHEIGENDAVLESFRNDLGPDRFDAAAARGARMNYDEIVTFVLHTLSGASSHGHRADPQQPSSDPST